MPRLRLTDHLTCRQVAEALKANVERFYREWDATSYAGARPRFDREQRRLWRYAERRSRRFIETVAQIVCPRHYEA